MTELTPEQRARLLAKAQRILQSQSQSQQPVDFRLGGLYENIMGGVGAVDTPGELIGETIKATAAGATRGIEGLLGLPETVGALAKRGFQFARGQEVQPMPDQTVLGGAFRQGVSALTGLAGDSNAMDFVPDSRLGRFAGTAGEFLGGAGALTKLTKPVVGTSVVSGVGSEAAGQATEDTAIGGVDIEPFARIAGAIATPYAGSKTLQALSKRSASRPTIEALKNEKNEAYRLVSQAGEGFEPEDVATLINKAQAEARVSGFLPETDQATTKALALLGQFEGRKIFMDDLDKIKRRLNKLYKSADDEVAILSIIKSIDDAVAGKASNSALMTAARAANSKYAKAQLLEKAFKKADDQISSTGSGGNVVNKYRQTLTSIKNDPKKARFFSDDELATMDRIVSGGFGPNTLRLIGKLSPSGNGLMTALNIGAVAANPAFIGVTIAGTTAKALSERQIIKAVEGLKNLVAAGGVKAAKFDELRGVAVELLSPQFVAPRTLGLTAQRPDEEELN
tara:strand:- start:43 stop:1572 length:1530 start_codon:yes stop_codon:yes gene_type:complete